MDNENEVVVDPNNEAVEETTETHEEPKAEKPKRTPQEELDYFEGRAKRLRKDLGLETEPKPEIPKEKLTLKSSELGYAEKAYLQGNDIRGNEEFAVIQKYLKDTGKSLDELVDETSVVGKIIRSEIKEMRDAKVTADAVPKGTKRSSSSTRDSVDYWVKKDLSEVPQEMKIAVVNRRIELEKDKNRSPYSPPIM